MMRLSVLLTLSLALIAAADDVVQPYRLMAGDLLRIEVFGFPEMRVEGRIPEAGTMPYPLLGTLPSPVGQTSGEVSTQVARLLADGYIRDPKVTVSVVDYAQRSAYVLGAVNRPGPVRLDPLRPMDALQAIGECGGFLDDADRDAMQLLRPDAGGPDHRQVLPLGAAAKGQAVVGLMHGDVILVPRSDRVYVLGQVEKPGALALPAREALTVSKAVSLAGGFGRFAREGKVQLVRPGAPPIVVDVPAVLEGRKGAEDPTLRAGDTVFVPESRF